MQFLPLDINFFLGIQNQARIQPISFELYTIARVCKLQKKKKTCSPLGFLGIVLYVQVPLYVGAIGRMEIDSYVQIWLYGT